MPQAQGRPILTSPCPRGGRREPKVSDGRGTTLADATTRVVLLSRGGLPCPGTAVRRVGVSALSGVAPLPATPLFKRLTPTSPRTRRG